MVNGTRIVPSLIARRDRPPRWRGRPRPGSRQSEVRAIQGQTGSLPPDHAVNAGNEALTCSQRTVARQRRLINTLTGKSARGREMSKQDEGFDYHRYRTLLAEAVDEPSRQALIELLIEERARDRLKAHSTSERLAITAKTVASILGTSRT